MSAAWEDLEEHVRNVYSMLLNLKDDNVTVARDVMLGGARWAATSVIFTMSFLALP